MYNEENKTKEDESTLVNTIDNLFCSFIVNDANITFCHLAFKMKNMHTYEPFEEWSDVVVSIRNEIMMDNFNALVKAYKDSLEFPQIVCHYSSADMEEKV